jgi:hypothetical protein
MYRASRSLAAALNSGEPPNPIERYRNPTDVLREHWYRRSPNLKKQIQKLRDDEPTRYAVFLQDSVDLFLGEPGAAVRVFHLPTA